MRKLVVGLASAGAVLAFTTAASAQDLGEQGSMALSADRLFGITSFSAKGELDLPGADEGEVSGTTVSLLWGDAPRVGVEGVEVPIPGAIPRLSFDFFVIDSLSLGGSLGHYSFSGEYDPGGDGDTRDLDSVSAFALNPRVGYVFPLGDTAYFWLRGGLTYMKVNLEEEEGDSEANVSVMQLNAEGAFVIGIADHFGFHVGPALDFPLSGKAELEDGDEDLDVDISVLSFGAYGGLVGWF